jgi:Major Facilitator Superfamily
MNEPVAQAEFAVQRQEPGVEAATSAPGHGRATGRAVMAILCYQGYAYTILGVGAPFIAKSFGLSQSAIARTYAWIALHALGALILSRMADRNGRRRVILLGLAVTPLASLGAALSHGIAGFIFFEIITYAAIGATFSSCFVMLAEALPIAERGQRPGLCASRHLMGWRSVRDPGAGDCPLRMVVAMVAGDPGGGNRISARARTNDSGEPAVGVGDRGRSRGQDPVLRCLPAPLIGAARFRWWPPRCLVTSPAQPS